MLNKEKEIIPPRVIVEVTGGTVVNIYTDQPVDIWICDWDNEPDDCGFQFTETVDPIYIQDNWEKIGKNIG